MKKLLLLIVSFLAIHFALDANTITPTTIPGSPFYCQHNFSTTFSTSGGVTPYTYTVMSGSTPSGITLNARTGYFGGVFKDTVATSYTFRIRSTDGAGDTVSRSYTMSVLVRKYSINGLTTLWATQGAPTRANLFDTWVSVANLVNNNGATGNDTTYFKNNGNSFLTSSVRLGTNNARTLAFETVDTVRATFLTNGFLGVGHASPTARVDIKGRNNSASNYALRVGGSSVADILTVQNNGRVGVNTTNSFALSVAPQSGQTGQFISYSPGFRVAMQISDDDATSGSVIMGSNALYVDIDENIVGIGAAAQSGNKLYIKESTASAIPLYINSQNGQGLHLLGYTSNDPYYRQDDASGVTKTVINTNGDSYFNGGQVGFTNATPTAYIHPGAGTAAAGTAPLKFTFGTLNTVAEDGAVEASGNDLYFADGIGRFKLGKVITGSDTMNVPIVAGTGAIYEKTITVTGAADGDVVSLGTTNAMATAGGFFFARVSGADTVTVTFMNVVGGNLNPASGTVKLTVFKN